MEPLKETTKTAPSLVTASSPRVSIRRRRRRHIVGSPSGQGSLNSPGPPARADPSVPRPHRPRGVRTPLGYISTPLTRRGLRRPIRGRRPAPSRSPSGPVVYATKPTAAAGSTAVIKATTRSPPLIGPRVTAAVGNTTADFRAGSEKTAVDFLRVTSPTSRPNNMETLPPPQQDLYRRKEAVGFSKVTSPFENVTKPTSHQPTNDVSQTDSQRPPGTIRTPTEHLRHQEYGPGFRNTTQTLGHVTKPPPKPNEGPPTSVNMGHTDDVPGPTNATLTLGRVTTTVMSSLPSPPKVFDRREEESGSAGAAPPFGSSSFLSRKNRPSPQGAPLSEGVTKETVEPPTDERGSGGHPEGVGDFTDPRGTLFLLPVPRILPPSRARTEYVDTNLEQGPAGDGDSGERDQTVEGRFSFPEPPSEPRVTSSLSFLFFPVSASSDEPGPPQSSSSGLSQSVGQDVQPSRSLPVDLQKNLEGTPGVSATLPVLPGPQVVPTLGTGPLSAEGWSHSSHSPQVDAHWSSLFHTVGIPSVHQINPTPAGSPRENPESSAPERGPGLIRGPGSGPWPPVPEAHPPPIHPSSVPPTPLVLYSQPPWSHLTPVPSGVSLSPPAGHGVQLAWVTLSSSGRLPGNKLQPGSSRSLVITQGHGDQDLLRSDHGVLTSEDGNQETARVQSHSSAKFYPSDVVPKIHSADDEDSLDSGPQVDQSPDSGPQVDQSLKLGLDLDHQTKSWSHVTQTIPRTKGSSSSTVNYLEPSLGSGLPELHRPNRTTSKVSPGSRVSTVVLLTRSTPTLEVNYRPGSTSASRLSSPGGNHWENHHLTSAAPPAAINKDSNSVGLKRSTAPPTSRPPPADLAAKDVVRCQCPGRREVPCPCGLWSGNSTSNRK